MQLLKLSEATAARRRVYLHLVDATDGISPETGEATGQPQISTNGAAFTNTSATLTAVGNGLYYVELTAGELGTLGFIAIRYKSANTAEFQTICQVVAFDPFAASNLGLTNLDATVSSRAPEAGGNVAAIKTKTDQLVFTNANKVDASIQSAGDFAQAAADKVWASATRTLTAFSTSLALSVWDVLESAIVTASSIGLKVKNNLDAAITSRHASGAAVASVTGNVDGNVTGSVGSVVGNVGGSVASVTGAVGSVTGAVGSVSGNVDGNVTGSVGSLAAQAKTDVNNEVLDVVNVDTFAEPAQGTPAATTTLRDKIGFLYKFLRNRVTVSATEIDVYNDDAVTVDHKSSHSDDGATYDRGEFATGP